MHAQLLPEMAAARDVDVLAHRTGPAGNVCQRVAPFMRKRSRRFRSTEFSPSVVFASTGKNATIQEHSRSFVVWSSTWMLMSRTIATIGVTCGTIAMREDR